MLRFETRARSLEGTSLEARSPLDGRGCVVGRPLRRRRFREPFWLVNSFTTSFATAFAVPFFFAGMQRLILLLKGVRKWPGSKYVQEQGSKSQQNPKDIHGFKHTSQNKLSFRQPDGLQVVVAEDELHCWQPHHDGESTNR